MGYSPHLNGFSQFGCAEEEELPGAERNKTAGFS